MLHKIFRTRSTRPFTVEYTGWIISVKLEWKIQDMWTGLFWKFEGDIHTQWRLDVWFIVFPTLPVHWIITRLR